MLVGSGWSVKIAGEGRPHECEHIGSGRRASVDSVDKWKTLSVGAAREPSGPSALAGLGGYGYCRLF